MKLSEKISKIGLGTVQFGMEYGISNSLGRTSEDEVKKILTLAVKSGIDLLDTASQYGESEKVLGSILSADHNFNIVTKTPGFRKSRFVAKDAEFLKTTFKNSLINLKEKKIYGLMIHHAEDLLADGGEFLYDVLLELKNFEYVEKVGVSVYTASHIDRLLSRYEFDLIQIPMNLLDQRLIGSGHLKTLKEKNIEVHIRSVFLQGLLLMDPLCLPQHFESVKKRLMSFHRDCKNNGITPLAAALDFILQQNETDKILVGVCTLQQFQEVLCAVSNEKSLSNYNKYAFAEECILNPSMWQLN